MRKSLDAKGSGLPPWYRQWGRAADHHKREARRLRQSAALCPETEIGRAHRDQFLESAAFHIRQMREALQSPDLPFDVWEVVTMREADKAGTGRDTGLTVKHARRQAAPPSLSVLAAPPGVYLPAFRRALNKRVALSAAVYEIEWTQGQLATPIQREEKLRSIANAARELLRTIGVKDAANPVSAPGNACDCAALESIGGRESFPPLTGPNRPPDAPQRPTISTDPTKGDGPLILREVPAAVIIALER